MDSFSLLENTSNEKTIKILGDIDIRLNQVIDDATDLLGRQMTSDQEVVASGDGPGYYQKHGRYYSIGYESHYDGVESQELLDWRQKFSYLKINGTAISTKIDHDDVNVNSSTDEQESTNSYGDNGTFFPPAFDPNLISASSLEIVGKSLCIQRLLRNSCEGNEGEDSDIDISDGVLEEVIAVDKRTMIIASEFESVSLSDDGEPALVDNNVISLPMDSINETLHHDQVSELFDKMWPTLAPYLTPFMKPSLT